MATAFAADTAPPPVDSSIPGMGRLLRFAALSMPIAAVEAPLTTYVPPLYAAIFGFNLATIGAIFLFARAWDALIDPAIGILSDRTRTRWGRRRPWIVVGAVIFVVGAFGAFVPPRGAGPIMLSAALFTLYLGYSMMTTPLSAWTGELSSQYHERTRVTTYAMVMTALALLLALVLPSALAARLAGHPATELAAMGAMVFVLLAITLPLGIGAVREPPLPTAPLPPLRSPPPHCLCSSRLSNSTRSHFAWDAQ